MQTTRNSTWHYVARGGYAAALFGLNFMIGATLTYIVGIPGVSGLVTGLTTGFLLTLAWKTSPRFGTVTTVFTLYCACAIPTVLMGPPGVYKVAVGFFAGLAYDTAAKLFGQRRLALYAAWTAFTFAILPATWYFLVALGLPGVDKFKKALPVLFAIFLIEGALGTWAGQWFFKKHLTRMLDGQDAA